MNLESFHQCSEQKKCRFVTVQCRIFRQFVHLRHVRRLRHGHNQEESEGNYLKFVPIRDSSSILGINLNHIYRAKSDPQVDNHSNFLH